MASFVSWPKIVMLTKEYISPSVFPRPTVSRTRNSSPPTTTALALRLAGTGSSRSSSLPVCSPASTPLATSLKRLRTPRPPLLAGSSGPAQSPLSWGLRSSSFSSCARHHSTSCTTPLPLLSRSYSSMPLHSARAASSSCPSSPSSVSGSTPASARPLLPDSSLLSPVMAFCPARAGLERSARAMASLRMLSSSSAWSLPSSCAPSCLRLSLSRAVSSSTYR